MQQTAVSIGLHKPKEPASGHFYEKPWSLSRVIEIDSLVVS